MRLLRTVACVVAAISAGAIAIQLVISERRDATRHEAILAKLASIDRASSLPAKWAYRIEAPPDSEFDRHITMLGSQGWEIVSMRRVSTETMDRLDGAGKMKYEVVMRRRIGTFE